MRYSLAMLLISSVCFASSEASPPQLLTENPDKTLSFGLNYYRSPMHGSFGSIDDRSIMLDFRHPFSKTLTFTGSLGLRNEDLKFNAGPQSYKGKAYSLGMRVYLE
jgi:hypothetical protein